MAGKQTLPLREKPRATFNFTCELVNYCRTKSLLVSEQNAPYFNALSMKVLGSSSPESSYQFWIIDSWEDGGTQDRGLRKIWLAIPEKKNRMWHKYLHWEAPLVLCTQNGFTSDWNMLRYYNSSFKVFQKYLKDSLWVLENHTDMLCLWYSYVILHRMLVICLSLFLKNECSKFKFKAMFCLLPSRKAHFCLHCSKDYKLS